MSFILTSTLTLGVWTQVYETVDWKPAMNVTECLDMNVFL